ncbi:MAG: APC family permease [Propionibacteriaceae bacterium]
MNLSEAFKRIVIGRKLASHQLGETLLPKRIALPVFASDALSSVAYAPDEILLTLSLAGMAAFAFSWKVGLLVAIVMLVVVASYRQNVHAYPSGGGDYEVATVNLGPNAGLTVASALLVDYVLTVAVSVSSGIQNARAFVPWITPDNAGMWAAVVILILMAMNLRGVRESGGVFAVPTYLFMFGVIVMIVWGLFRILVLGQHVQTETSSYEVVADPSYAAFTGFAAIALLARTFSSGCAALTGVEAISNGVPAFKKPKSKNAATTLALLGGIAVSMLIGILTLANLTGTKLIDPHGGAYFVKDGVRVEGEAPTVMAQLAGAVFGGFPPAFFAMMLVTLLILVLAANTAFNGFPVLGSILAKDGYLPRALYTRGDRLAYSNGIVALALVAVGLVIAFNASVTALIQLYVVGVFVSFTVSQTGMMRHWTRHLKTEKDPRVRTQMKRSRIINAIGLTFTGVVLVIVLISKFLHGAYLAIIAMVFIFFVMKSIHRHYAKVAREVEIEGKSDSALPSRVRAVILVSAVNKPTARAVAFARAMRPTTLEAVIVSVDPVEVAQTITDWEAQDYPVALKVIASPFREVTNPFVNYVKSMRSANPRDVVCVFVPEFVVGHWWESLLHNQTALIIRTRLHFIPGIMVITVPYQLRSSQAAIDRLQREDPLAWRRIGTGLSEAEMERIKSGS